MLKTRGEGDDGLAREHAALVQQARVEANRPQGDGAVRAEHKIKSLLSKETRSKRDDGLARKHPTLVQQQHRGGVIGGDGGGITVEGKAIVVKAPSGDGAVRAAHHIVI